MNMNLVAQLSLFLWLPVVVFLFSAYPPRRAVISAFVFAWLALPNVGWPINGLPDYTKVSATSSSVILCMLLFDQKRLFALRPRWYDLPAIAWCIGPFFTALANDMGITEACSALLSETERWGLAYLIGRVYLTDRDSMLELAQGILIGGLCYIPFCLVEIRLSPLFEKTVYGISRWEGTRYGGYRPRVFLATGLELGMWMTNATFLCFVLWLSGAVKSIRNVSMGLILVAMIGTTILAKSTGAIALLGIGIALVLLIRKTKKVLIVWILIAFAPTYCVLRAYNLWSGQEAVEVAQAIVGEDRADSLLYRFNMENLLTRRAIERPILGWGRFNRFQVTDSTGRILTVPDGYWIIALGTQGIVGLVSMIGILILPLALTVRRFPISVWFTPEVAPLVGVGMFLALTMIDFLSNAMMNPIYPLAAGGLICQLPFRPGREHTEAEQSLTRASTLVAEGHLTEAEGEFRRVIDQTATGEDLGGRTLQARALDGLTQTLVRKGKHQEAEETARDALVLRDWLATDASDPDRFRDLAVARETYSRVLAEAGRAREAIAERGIALKTWDILVRDHPHRADFRDHRANTLNDLAWVLCVDPDPEVRDPARALALAEEAVRSSSDRDAFWNTLGVARYRAGQWAESIEALEHSALTSPGGSGTAFDHYFLTMAWFQLRRDDLAQEWMERGLSWTARHQPGHPTLERLRAEAATLLSSESQTRLA